MLLFRQNMKNRLIPLMLLVAMLSACGPAQTPALPTIPPPARTSTPALPTIPPPARTSTPAASATSALVMAVPATALPAEPLESPTPRPSATLQPSATPLWVRQGPNKIVCPILLYHHIGTSPKGSLYYISPEDFRAEMQALKDWGYTTIPVTLLVRALNFGAELPARPIIITFDDGDASVYEQAFPILQEMGFTGTNYIIYNYIGADGYMTANQIKALAAAGWETGSHSLSHANLINSKHLSWEVVDSRYFLRKLLGVPIDSFAYPFGMVNGDVRSYVRDNYRAGMGLGIYTTQRSSDIYYLWRRPVDPGWDLQKFGSFLPWNSPPAP